MNGRMKRNSSARNLGGCGQKCDQSKIQCVFRGRRAASVEERRVNDRFVFHNGSKPREQWRTRATGILRRTPSNGPLPTDQIRIDPFSQSPPDYFCFRPRNNTPPSLPERLEQKRGEKKNPRFLCLVEFFLPPSFVLFFLKLQRGRKGFCFVKLNRDSVRLLLLFDFLILKFDKNSIDFERLRDKYASMKYMEHMLRKILTTAQRGDV